MLESYLKAYRIDDIDMWVPDEADEATKKFNEAMTKERHAKATMLKSKYKPVAQRRYTRQKVI